MSKYLCDIQQCLSIRVVLVLVRYSTMFYVYVTWFRHLRLLNVFHNIGNPGSTTGKRSFSHSGGCGHIKGTGVGGFAKNPCVTGSILVACSMLALCLLHFAELGC